MSITQMHWHAVGDAVVVTGWDDLEDRKTTCYGWVDTFVVGPDDARDGIVGWVRDRNENRVPVWADDKVEPGVGCACGNPFTLCHPDA